MEAVKERGACPFGLVLAERVKALEQHAKDQNGFIRELRADEIPGLREEIGKLRDAVDTKMDALGAKIDARLCQVQTQAQQLETARGEKNFRVWLAVVGAVLAGSTALITAFVVNYLNHIGTP